MPSALASLSGFLVSLSTSRSAQGGPSAEAFTTDGIASPSYPLLGCSPSHCNEVQVGLGEDNAVNYPMSQQHAGLFLGMSSGSVSIFSYRSNLKQQAIKHSAYQSLTRSGFSMI